VDEYVTKILTSTDTALEIRIEAMGAFRPTPPDDTDPLLELIARFASEAGPASRLPRQLDAILFERLARRRDLTPNLQHRLALTPATERHVRLLAAFLRGQFQVPSAVDKVLTAPLLPPARTQSEEMHQPLFDLKEPDHPQTR